MMPRYRLLLSQVRVGFVPALAIFDLLITLLIFALDVIRFWRRDLYLSVVVGYVVGGLTVSRVTAFVSLSAFFFLGLPFLCTFAVVARPQNREGLRWLMRWSWAVVLWHAAFSLGLAAYVFLPQTMEALSGPSLTYGAESPVLEPEFRSYVGWILTIDLVGSFAWFVYLVLSWVGFDNANKFLRSMLKPPPQGELNAFQKYTSRLATADRRGEYAPTHAPHLVNLNCGSSAPELKRIRRKAGWIFHHYQKSVAGSEASAKFLRKVYEGAVADLQAILQEVGTAADPDITLFPGTSRALEVAVLRAFDVGKNRLKLRRLTLSPLEHDTICSFADWLGNATDIAVDDLGNAAQHQVPGPAFFRASYDEKIDTLKQTITNAISESLVPLTANKDWNSLDDDFRS
jgi:hypothetical protein